jgi:hypothetical protein
MARGAADAPALPRRVAHARGGCTGSKRPPRRFGSAPDNDLVLPDGPAHAGSFAASFRGITVHPEAGAVLLGGKALEGPRLLKGDDQAEPDVLQVGRLRLTAIKRGIRWAIRAKDPESAVLRDFKGIESWPIEEKWRIEADWAPYPEPRQRMIATAQGTHDSVEVPGLAKFTLDGVPISLEPILESRTPRSCSSSSRTRRAGKRPTGAGGSCTPPSQGREDRPGLQPRLQPSLRVHGLCHLSAAPSRESPPGPHRRGGEEGRGHGSSRRHDLTASPGAGR